MDHATSTVLITGATGFLGRHVVRALLARGEAVRALSHGITPEPQDPLFQRAEIVRGVDVRDAAAIDRAVAGCECVIHLVSNFRRAGSDRADAHAINVGGTENVLRACLRHGVRHLLHCSTIGVHGDVREIPATETTPFNPGDTYQRTKVIAEERVEEVRRREGLPVTILRPISLFGPEDRRMLKLFRMVRSGWFLRVGSGEVFFQPAYVDDVVRGFLTCLRNPRAVGDTFILGSETSVTLNELVSTIADLIGVRVRTITVPMGPMVALARAVELACAPFGVEPPLHRRRLSFYRNNRVFSLAKARDVLGFTAEVPLREALARTLAWYRSAGWL